MRSLLVTCVLLLSACNNKSTSKSERQNAPARDFIVRFYPAFAYHSEFRISKGTEQEIKMKIWLGQYEEDSVGRPIPPDTLHIRAFPISQGEQQSIFNGINLFNQKILPTDSGVHLDGINVEFISERFQQNDTIWVHPLGRKMQPGLFDILDPLLAILDIHLKEDGENICLMKTEAHIESDVVARQVPGDTVTLKVISFRSGDKRHITQLKAAIDSIPTHGPVNVELFDVPDTEYLKLLAGKNSQVNWKVLPGADTLLWSAGINPTRITMFRLINYGEKW